MGTVIAHGKSPWGRANKNKRVDEEMEAEVENIRKTAVRQEKHTEIINELTDEVEPGEVVLKKVADGAVVEHNPTPVRENRPAAVISHSPSVDTVNKSEPSKTPSTLGRGVHEHPKTDVRKAKEEKVVDKEVKKSNEDNKPKKKSSPKKKSTSSTKNSIKSKRKPQKINRKRVNKKTGKMELVPEKTQLEKDLEKPPVFIDDIEDWEEKLRLLNES